MNIVKIVTASDTVHVSAQIVKIVTASDTVHASAQIVKIVTASDTVQVSDNETPQNERHFLVVKHNDFGGSNDFRK